MTFRSAPNVSKYFIICTVTTSNLNAGQALHWLRHDLLHEGVELGDFFHATYDKQEVRDRVFKTILGYQWMVQATICEKSKAAPQVTRTPERFYKIPWYFHLKNGVGPFVPAGCRFTVTAASLGTKKQRLSYVNALEDVARQNVLSANWKVDFRPAMADPWLQIADYCAWAFQRKWERGDSRSYDLIKDRITYEYDLWAHGSKRYY